MIICNDSQINHVTQHYPTTMFRGLFGKRSDNYWNGLTGIYKIENNNMVELGEQPGNGSFNSITEHFGYNIAQIHIYQAFDSDLIEVIGLKIFTLEPVYVVASDITKRVRMNTVLQELRDIDWGFEYSSHAIEDILDQGLEILTLEYLNSVLDLELEGDSLYNSPKLGLFLNFQDGVLSNYSSSDWANTSSKWIKAANEQLFENMKSEALQYHGNKIEAMEEVNLQSSAFSTIPYAINNEYIPLHTKDNGNINFFNLLAAHYNQLDGQPIKLEEFQTVNMGRFIALDELTFEVSGFIFQFDSNGMLISSTKK